MLHWESPQKHKPKRGRRMVNVTEWNTGSHLRDKQDAAAYLKAIRE